MADADKITVAQIRRCEWALRWLFRAQRHSSTYTDIHELLSLDLLHQVIKGTFKDHIVMWVNEYLLEVHREAQGLDIIADIDHRYIFCYL